jgi:putative ABC transport system ATP-binding protein
MIELSNIKKAFNQGQPNEYWALHGIDLALEAGKVTAFRGPSGSGKTTLLTIVGCLSRPTSGRVRFKGEDISGLPERFLTDIRRQSFGFVFQQFNLIRGCRHWKTSFCRLSRPVGHATNWLRQRKGFSTS